MNALRTMMVLVLAGGIAGAQDKPKTPAKPAAKPAAKAPASKGGASTASKGGPTTASKGGPTTASRGGPTTASKAGPTTARGPAPAGRGPAPARGPAGGARPEARAGGGRPEARPGGGRVPAGSHVTRTASGHEVTRRADGRPADVRRGDMAVHHNLNGNRRVSVERADHSRIVADRRGHGYVQHPYNYRGHEYAHRTYYRDGRPYDRFYRGYAYHGVMVEAYAPSVYFAPAFYGWAYNPWVAPISFGWGFAAAPWYGAYGFYFTPYAVYPSASFWLADYIISQQLAAAYAANAAMQAQTAAGAGAVALTPDVKGQIAAEVQRQMALENQEAQTVAANNEPDASNSGIGRMLSDGIQHVFVAGKDLDLVDATGTECAVSEGDAMQLTGPPAADATAANLVVLASKGGNECRKGVTVAVNFADLQDMQNAMRETIDQGLQTLQAKQGTGGLPAAPASAKAAPVQAAFAKDAPPPDADVQTQVTQQLAEGDKAEQAVLAEAPADGAAPAAAAAEPAAAPVTISMGQSIDEVTAILGTPKSIVELGPKKIYVYKDMKITFNSGKVVDVQ